MFWILRKIFGLGILAALIFFALQFPVAGRPLRDYVLEFYQAPLVREAIRQSRDVILTYLHKDVGSEGQEDAQPLDRISDEDREELERILKEKAK